ncbi:deoxynucleoside kinase [Oceanobacillus sp. Castelsardo]|uniref:deoxynucleoside kinase n=1 Tax=Oceanobacillus sp. Castelsardo TaxID=1851204 RepID=UPI000838A27A|nr:deoxynucleoside kinase [Oceanobacillus sp. Castelsardo]
MSGVPFIAIEGPIGIGKTSLAQKLSSHYHFYLLKEIVEDNPFLGEFYDDMESWSFQTEMFFLCNRMKQLEDIHRNYLLKNKSVIADYHISKNMIFANRTLQSRKLEKYKKVYEILTDDIPMPNILIYLYGSMDTILKRINKRGRDIEKNIKSSYLLDLSNDYEAYISQFERDNPSIPVIRIDGDKVDFVHIQEDLQMIINLVDKQLSKLDKGE